MLSSEASPPSLDIEPDLLVKVRAALDEIRAGRMVILVDDEDRENEGDLVFAAERVTPEHINFMAKHARGLICLTLTEAQVDRLELPMMTWRSGPPLGTAFTLSIEARHGVTTGISAADRARTVQVASSPTATAEDIVTPGHVFPLRARNGGVLVRTGQTEGSVDLARLAGLQPAGVICEIMNDDGTMARMPDLERFAAQHGLQILTVADLIRYRLQTERLVRRIQETTVQLDVTGNTWRAVAYEVAIDKREFLALQYGEPDPNNTLCRVHRGSLVADLFSSSDQEGGQRLREAVQKIEQDGAGVIVYIPSTAGLRDELARVAGAPAGEPGGQAQGSLREFGLGAQVLRELGIRKIRLLTNNPRKIVGLRGFGLEVTQTLQLSNTPQ
ncbi:MAG TPA: 3,4-dihydroxy-2-butanone-4-phosphate synthase [Polyangiaceae bacterium]|jgi:3,4-dihydroxy 2-butanone 4-phosphate synthase/GTP cyclohydrolase II|nr:3,4-dihydroxy-2-butanone-4-phosphate synthase [Polyangiaceae bacterium]